MASRKSRSRSAGQGNGKPDAGAGRRPAPAPSAPADGRREARDRTSAPPDGGGPRRGAPAAPSGGGRSRLLTGLAIGLGALALIAAALFLLTGGDEETPVSGTDETAQEAERIRRENLERDRVQIRELTDTSRSVRDGLIPVLDQMAEAMPLDPAEEGEMARPQRVEEWQQQVSRLRESYGETPSGETATNVARGALTSALAQLDSALGTYELALDADGRLEEQLIEQAREQRGIFQSVWETGATQLDFVNIEAGNGHQHVNLPPPGRAVESPDGLPEGAEARHGEGEEPHAGE